MNFTLFVLLALAILFGGKTTCAQRIPWPNAIIPYEISPEFSDTEIISIQAAIADYREKTCLRWVPRNGEDNYAFFQARNTTNFGCAFTSDCYKQGVTDLVFFQDCRNTGVIIHEMGHVACIDHEQGRLDRDSYVVVGENCSENARYDGAHMYDYLSAMHYPCRDFIGISQCLFPKLPGVTDCGQFVEEGRLSVLDAEKINDLYNCGGCMSYRFRYPEDISPDQAFFSGFESEGSILFTCRAYVDGNIYIGKASNSLQYCWVANNGQEFRLSSGFEILTNPANSNLTWVPSDGSRSRIPAGALAGGRSKSNESAYIGRCRLVVNGTMLIIPGTVLKNTPYEIKIAHDGLEVICTDFEILTCS